MRTERKNCPMRHPNNGNCTVAGGFCTAVADPICEALHNAYDCGQRSINPEDLRKKGKWEEHDRYICNSDDEPVAKIGVVFICSECGRQEYHKEPYCHCGAKMEG